MRVETELTLFTALFVTALGVLYWFTSYENAGTTLLVIGGIAYAMMCGYLLIQAVRLHHSGTSRPEDRERGEAAEGAGEVGYFPAATVWPAAIGLGAVLVGLGLVFGVWFIVIGVIVLAGAVIGYAVEAQARP